MSKFTKLNRTAAGRVLTALALAGLGAAAGCHSHDRDARVRGEEFLAADAPRSVTQFCDVQAAAGARTDGTLRAYHFDCEDLNSLGQDKLDTMLKDDDACAPLVVYLDLPHDDQSDARQDSVRVYLKDRGLADGQIKLEHGANTKHLYPTGPALRAKKLLDTGAPVAQNPEPAGSPTPGMGGGK